MRKLLVALCVVVLSLSAVDGAQIVTPPKPTVVATPTPAPRRPILGLFGKRPTPTPAPATPAPTPKPKAKSRPKATPAPDTSDEEKPKAKAEEKKKGEPKAEEKTEKPTEPAPKEEAKPAPGEAEKPAAAPDTKTQPPAEAKPEGGKKGRKGKNTPPKPDTSNMDEATKFKTLKATAQEDPAIKELKAKAAGAISDSDANAASVAYNKALFRKIRELDPTMDAYVEKMESAMMKRLNSERKAE